MCAGCVVPLASLVSSSSTTRNWMTSSFCFSRPKTVFEVITELWNSSEFNPIAPPSDCHFDFQVVTDCLYNLVQALAPAMPEKVEDIELISYEL
jgi:hypothetical protein